MQLYNTKVIPSAVDAQWAAPALPDMNGTSLLVISKPFQNGGAEEVTLQKMMSACKLSSAEYAMLQIGEERYSWQGIAAVAPKVVLLLGVHPAELSIQALFRLNIPNAFGGHFIIPSVTLEELERNPAEKKDLWTNGLKPMFGL